MNIKRTSISGIVATGALVLSFFAGTGPAAAGLCDDPDFARANDCAPAETAEPSLCVTSAAFAAANDCEPDTTGYTITSTHGHLRPDLCWTNAAFATANGCGPDALGYTITTARGHLRTDLCVTDAAFATANGCGPRASQSGDPELVR